MRTAVALAVVAACGAPHQPSRPPVACALPEPVVVVRDGAAVLERFDLDDRGPWLRDGLPASPAYAAYRHSIIAAGADTKTPALIETTPDGDAWARDRENRELALTGVVGTIRPMVCLDAVLFARQHERHDELAAPSEFSAVILRRDHQLRVYFGAGDQLFPPKTVYGIDQARADFAAGWQVLAHLHNHTIQRRDGAPVLGVTAPSSNDVHLLRNVGEDMPFAAVWVTNGMYTIEIPRAQLARLRVAGD